LPSESDKTRDMVSETLNRRETPVFRMTCWPDVWEQEVVEVQPDSVAELPRKTRRRVIYNET
jgi:hypothetical protein